MWEGYRLTERTSDLTTLQVAFISLCFKEKLEMLATVLGVKTGTKPAQTSDPDHVKTEEDFRADPLASQPVQLPTPLQRKVYNVKDYIAMRRAQHKAAGLLDRLGKVEGGNAEK